MSELPRRSVLLEYPARFLLWISGWRVVGDLPPLSKYVIIIAPHTSHWDTILFSAGACALRLKGHFMVKHTAFWGPSGWLLRRFGGIPVNREEKNGASLVDQAIAAFREREHVVLVLAPEGTRARQEEWRSGFYRIAEGANVPVQLVYADFKKKEVGAGPLVEVTGDVDRDLEIIRDFYAQVEARHPERFSPVQFRE
jgi:1-acyl-sn-glycerol-3-phosphate acyltransferase